MAKYKVMRLTGDYDVREDRAVKLGLDAVIHFHFNAVVNRDAVGAMVLYAGAYDKREASLAGRLSAKLAAFLKTKDRGGVYLKDGVRAEWFIDEGKAPTLIFEPQFVSNPGFAKWIKKAGNRVALGKFIAGCLVTEFPQGAEFGFSLGHKGKTSAPNDRGASVYGGGTEADMAEGVMEAAIKALEAESAPKVVTDKSYPTLAEGSKGRWVVKVQSALRRLGYHNRDGKKALVVDGDFGPETKAAVKRFQGRKRLSATGKVNRATYRALGL